MHMLQRMICIFMSAHGVVGVLQSNPPSNLSFCLNGFSPPQYVNGTGTCPCSAQYIGRYCQVNTTLGPIIITSATLSLLACLVQFYFRCKFRQFSQWPNYIVYCRSVTDFMFSLHLIILQCILLQKPDSVICSLTHSSNATELDNAQTCSDAARGPCTYFSFVFQFTLVGSLLWFGVGSYDYWKTISDPFVHPSTYKRTYTGWVLLISLAGAAYGVFGGVGGGEVDSTNQLYREGMQACWTSTTDGKFNTTNIFTMYVWLGLALVVTMVVGAIGYIKMRSGGTPKTLTKRIKAIEASRAQLMAFLLFWMVWGVLFALQYFGTQLFGGLQSDYRWTSYPMMGLLPLNGFVNAVVWLNNNRQEIVQAYKHDSEMKLTQQRTRSLQDAQDRDVLKREEEKNDMSQALKDELLLKIASGMNEVLTQPNDYASKENNMSIAKLIFDGRPPKVRSKVWTAGESRIPKLFRCPAVDQAREVEFIAHRPNAFQFLRESCYGVSDDKYLESFKSLSAKLLSGGKSGALFFSTPDNKYLVKTLEPGSLFKSSELGVLLEVIDSYCLHMTPRKYRRQSLQRGQRVGCNSLITKIFGCYTIKIYGQTLEFYVMEKLDPESSKLKVTERYDLKGSWVARHSKKAGTGKDQNFQGQTINLAPSLAQDIFMQSVSDVHFFEKNKIMDYSLLLAVHRCRDARIKDKHCTFGKTEAELGEVKVHVVVPEENKVAPNTLGVSQSAGKLMGGEDGHLEMDEFVRTISSSVPVHKKFEGGMQSAFMEGPGVYFMGIIDPLQKWDCSKICESFLKRFLLCKGIGISAVAPPLFATRFLLMMLKNLDVSLASLASLDPEYRESYGIERVEIINHKQNEDQELMYLWQLVRFPEERDLERVPSASLSHKSAEVVGRMMHGSEEVNLVACEAWELESDIISDPTGRQSVIEYRKKHGLGPIGTRQEATTPTSIFQTLITPVTTVANVLGGIGESAVSRLTSSVGRGSVSPVLDGEEEKDNRASLHRSSSRVGISAATSPTQKNRYIAPAVTPTTLSPSSSRTFFPPTISTSTNSSSSSSSSSAVNNETTTPTITITSPTNIVPSTPTSPPHSFQVAGSASSTSSSLSSQ